MAFGRTGVPICVGNLGALAGKPPVAPSCHPYEDGVTHKG